MGKLTIFNTFSNLDSFPEFQRFVSAFLQQIQNEFNGNINFVSNVESSGPHDLTFANGTTYIQVAHDLKRVPTGIMPLLS